MESTRIQRMSYWWSRVTFIISIIFMGNMIYFMILHQRKDAELGHKTRCVAKEGINHPIFVTADTDMDFVVDVGRMFYIIFFVGVFINAMISFIIVAWILFIIVRNMNKLKKEEEAASEYDGSTGSSGMRTWRFSRWMA